MATDTVPGSRAGRDPAALSLHRVQRLALRLVVGVSSFAAAAVTALAALRGSPRVLAWAAMIVVGVAVATIQLRLGRIDVRVFAVAWALATFAAALVAPGPSVPVAVTMVALASTVVLSTHGPGWLAFYALAFGYALYASAIVIATVGRVPIGTVIGLGAVASFTWLLLTNLIGDMHAGEGSYRTLFDRVPVGLYRTSISGEVVDANEAFCDLFGMTREELVGMNARDLLVDSGDLDRLRADLAASESLVHTQDLQFHRADGTVIWVRDRTIAIVGPDGQVLGYEGDLQDVTDEKRHVAELEALVKSKSELIGAVSHEIRTPLTAVVGFLDLLSDSMRSVNGETRELLTMALEQSHEVAAIVEDLLTAARIDNQELLIHPETFAVADAADGAIRSLATTDLAMADVVVGEGLSAFGDAGRVRQILRNLLSNARRYGRPPIRVEATRLGDRVAITVADAGDEIPPDVAANMFDAFFSGVSVSSQPGSIGLGLSVSRRLSRLMGGDLVHRRVGAETHFVLYLPADPAVVRVA